MMEAPNRVFNGARITEARELRQRSMADLASEIGVTRQTVSLYEANKQSPKPEVLVRLADALRVRIDYFLQPTRADRRNPIFFRSFASATKQQRIAADRTMTCIEEISSIVKDYLPPVNVPDFNIQDPLTLSEAQIDGFAEKLRRFWGLDDGPINPLITLLENNGIIIVSGNFETEKLHAFSLWTDDSATPIIFSCTDMGASVKSRFDVAHELGHLLLHKYLDKAKIAHRNDFTKIEYQANRFAGSFLMPRSEFERDAYKPSIDLFHALKPRWRTSIASMIMRSHQIGLTDELQDENLWKYLSRRGYRKHEPLDDTLPMEQPEALRYCIRQAIDKGKITKAEFMQRVYVTGSEVDRLIGFDGFFASPLLDRPWAQHIINATSDSAQRVIIYNPAASVK